MLLCRFAFAFVCLFATGCDGSRLLTLGRNPEVEEAPERPHFTLVRRVDELVVEDSKSDNPTLTGDLREIYFSSNRGDDGGSDVWFAERASAGDRFGEPQQLAAINTDENEASPAISLDGGELWFGAHNDAGIGELDIWVTKRTSRGAEWSEPTLVPGVNTPEDDIPRPPGFGGRVMPLGSRAMGTGFYATYLASRVDEASDFGAPVLLSELLVPEESTIDAFLSEDGLALYFNLTPGSGETKGDLYVARRLAVTDGFGDPEPLSELNSEGDDRDPWLSPDGKRLFFSSDRDGTLNIYEAVRSDQ